MAETDITIRAATPADVAAMADVDRRSWPAALATTDEEFAARIAAFPAGQLVAMSAGQIVGTASAQRITAQFLAAHSDSYDTITDGNQFTASHTDAGEIYQLIGVGVSPDFRGHRLGRLLVDHQIEQARRLTGVERILGFTRPVRFARNGGISIEEYVRSKDADGKPLDPVLAFHLEAGARIVSIHPDFRPNDVDSCGYGVLIEYVGERPVSAG